MKHNETYGITMISTIQVINSLGYYTKKHIRLGWEGYLITFMFAPLKGSRDAVLNQMQKALERVYATMLTRIVRKPHSPENSGKLPIWLACPDLPVPKREKQDLRTVTINEGLHMHAICLIPPQSRLSNGLQGHIVDKQGLYVRDQSVVRHIDAKPITSRPKYVTKYVFKSLERGRFGADDIILLPRAPSEL